MLAGLWEFPNEDKKMDAEDIKEWMAEHHMEDAKTKAAGKGKHIFSHVEWHMGGYFISLKEMPETLPGEESGPALFLTWEEIRKEYPVPNAFAVYKKYLDQRYGGEEE